MVIDNAAYHTRLTEDCITPKTATKKDDIIEYMRAKRIVPPPLLEGYLSPDAVQALLLDALRTNVPFQYVPPSLSNGTDVPGIERYRVLTKAQLLSMIPAKKKTYRVDEKAKGCGVKVVRLPPYHCDFNPIELVWATAKAAVAKRNVTYNLTAAMRVMEEEVKACDAANWQKLEQHAMGEEQKVISGDTVLISLVQKAIERCDEAAESEQLIVMISDGDGTSEEDVDEE